ncbi:MAG: peptidoglycan editing factor PgeF [Proteobacteria bacterium]|nr:peptidoglycan editing factor PgeF [Pseudomonadota bacterium]
MTTEQSFLLPEWPAPSSVRAAVTTRLGGHSLSPYGDFNLAAHVGDDVDSVQQNRSLLTSALRLPAEPVWLNQVHSSVVVDAADKSVNTIEADASYTKGGGVCAVMTADCLPVLFCNRAGSVVAAAHAGWRGLANGILEKTVAAMNCEPQEILAWLGPAIGPMAFEVGEEVRDAFIAQHAVAEDAFIAQGNNKWLADIYALARTHLQAVGVTQFYGGDYCTFTDEQRFYSYRRDGVTGRMASLIWLDS